MFLLLFSFIKRNDGGMITSYISVFKFFFISCDSAYVCIPCSVIIGDIECHLYISRGLYARFIFEVLALFEECVGISGII